MWTHHRLWDVLQKVKMFDFVYLVFDQGIFFSFPFLPSFLPFSRNMLMLKNKIGEAQLRDITQWDVWASLYICTSWPTSTKTLTDAAWTPICFFFFHEGYRIATKVSDSGVRSPALESYSDLFKCVTLGKMQNSPLCLSFLIYKWGNYQYLLQGLLQGLNELI